MATPTSFISMEDKKDVAMSMAMHYLVCKTKAGLDQLEEGLGIFRDFVVNSSVPQSAETTLSCNRKA